MGNQDPIFEYLELIAEHVPANFYCMDLQNRFAILNERTLAGIGGKTKSDVIGKNVYEFYKNKDIADELQKDIDKIIATGVPSLVEDKIVDVTTGKIRYFSATRAPLRNKKGDIVGVIGTSIETTDAKEKEQLILEKQAYQIEQQQQEKFNKIVEQVVHDIRSPIATMQMVLPNCEIYPEHSRVILNKSAIKIQDIASQLLVRFKPHESKDKSANIKSSRAPTLISADILEIIAEKKYEYSHLSVDFNSKITNTGQFAFINVDLMAFRCMISNLINNAVDALNGELGTVTIHLGNINNEVKIIIEDNGCGMPEAVKEKILNNITVTEGKKDGHGIGFGQIRDTLHNNDGHLTIESSSGIGTQIILTFPQVEALDWICTHITIKNDDLIIILDDDSSIHGAWDARFERILPGANFKHFERGSDVVAFINTLSDAEKEHIFMLADYELLKQEINGLDVIAKAKITRSVLVTSHHNNEKVRNKALESNTKILPKPLAADVPITVIENKGA